jgi:arylsulfatase
VFYVKDGRLHCIHKYLGLEEHKVTSTVDVPEGKSTLRYEFEPTGEPDMRNGRSAPGRGHLYINGERVGNPEFPTTVPITFGIEALSCGHYFGEAVSHENHAPFTFTGTIKKVVTDISGELIEDDGAKGRKLMAQW